MPNEQLVGEFIERAENILKAYPPLQGNRPIARALKEQIDESVEKLKAEIRASREAVEEAPELANTLDNLVQAAHHRVIEYHSVPSSTAGRRKTRGKRIRKRRGTKRR